MKITKQHFAHMKQEMERALGNKTIAACRAYLRGDYRVKDLEKRLRWDLAYAAGLTGFFCREIYPYANDTHIDTALKQITKELEQANHPSPPSAQP